MPNKYEREIEEILRNLERGEPKAGFGQRVSQRMRRGPGTRRSISMPHLNFTEWCMVIAIVAALAGGGWAQAMHMNTIIDGNVINGGGNIITGILALIGATCIVLIAISNFIAKPRYQAPSRFNNVTRLPGNPLRRMATSWHLLVLKMRYRNKGNRER